MPQPVSFTRMTASSPSRRPSTRRCDPGPAVLDGVVHQIDHRLLHQRAVDLRGHEFSGQLHGSSDPLGRRPSSRTSRRPPAAPPQRLRLGLDGLFLGPPFDPREQQQVADDRVQAVDLARARCAGTAGRWPCSSRPSSSSVSTKPLIEVIGVRSSCETLATKSRRTFSKCRSRVTSCSTISTPIFCPCASCSAVPWAFSQRSSGPKKRRSPSSDGVLASAVLDEAPAGRACGALRRCCGREAWPLSAPAGRAGVVQAEHRAAGCRRP